MTTDAGRLYRVTLLAFLLIFMQPQRAFSLAPSPKRIEALTATGGAMMIGLGGILLLAGDSH